MEAQQKQREIQATVLMELNQVYMHRLLNKDKNLFTSGILRVAKLNNNQGKPVHFVNLNSFYYGIQPNSFFIRMVYPDTVSYIFPHFENGLSAVSLPTNPAFSEALDQLLARVANLYDLKSAQQNPEIQGLVLQHYPNIETQQIHNPDRVKKFITDTGNFLNKFFTTTGGYLKTGVQKTGGFIEGKISEGQTTHVSEATKNKWQNVKQGTTNIFNVSTDFASKMLAPVVTKAKEYSNEVGNKINQSTNPAVKYAKQLTVVSGKAVGSAVEGLVKGSIEVSKEVGHQSKKIIDKKCGPEIIQTIVGSKEEEVGKQKEKAEKQQQKEQKERKVDKEERKDLQSQKLYPQINKE